MAYVYRAECLVDAPIERVWQVLVDLDRYPSWNPFTVTMASRLEPGEPIDMTVRLGLLTLPQREWVRDVAPPRRLVWRLDTLPAWLLWAERTQTLIEADGRTHYVTVDVIRGVLSPLVHLLLGGAVQRGFDGVARALPGAVAATR